MVDRPRSTAWKWVSLGLLALVLAALPVLGNHWVVSGLGESGPTHDPAGASFGLLVLGFGIGLAVWVAAAVLARRRMRVAGRRTYLATTAVVVLAVLAGAAVWTPVLRQASRQDELLTAVDRLDRMMPAGYRMQASDDRQDAGPGFVEPRRAWSAPASARPCQQLGPVLRRWAGHEPGATPRDQYGGCTFDTTRYGWDVSVRVDADTVELTTHA